MNIVLISVVILDIGFEVREIIQSNFGVYMFFFLWGTSPGPQDSPVEVRPFFFDILHPLPIYAILAVFE
jgi:hypothetical protein